MKRLFALMLISLFVVAGTAVAESRIFRTHLTGNEEAVPVDTLAQGQAIFQLNKDGTELSYILIVANIEDVTQAHIHRAPAGVNGPIVAFLFFPVHEGVTVNGILAEGTLTDADLIGPLAGLTLSDLVAEIEAGNTYVNVHTLAHPGGEIRGQIE